MLRERIRDPRNSRSSQSYAQVSDPHCLSPRLIEPARQQHLIWQRAATHIAQRIRQIEEIKHPQRAMPPSPMSAVPAIKIPAHLRPPRPKRSNLHPARKPNPRPTSNLLSAFPEVTCARVQPNCCTMKS